jgi:hypothetical protein
MESKKINQLATELAPDLSDLTIIGDPTTGISKKITLSQMASLFTGTVEEYANFAAFPLVGVADTIYIAKDTNVIYRWDSTAYVVLSPNVIASLVFNDANGFDGTIALVGSVATLTITTALTSGSVPFIGASGALLQDNANFFWDDTNNRLGLGTNAPTTALDVFGSGIIGRINGTSTNNAYLGFSSAGTNKWSVGNVQSDHRFRIFSEANSAELISVLQTGEFGIGIANPTTKFHIDGAASALIANLDANVSVAKSISFRSDNSNRINLEVSGTESGSNVGADFFLRTYTDLGALIETPFTIVRSTGVTTIKSLTLTNVLSVANGGTGSATQNFVDLTSIQTAAGAKTFSAITTISNATASTSTTTGALLVTGGIGIGGALFGTSAVFNHNDAPTIKVQRSGGTDTNTALEFTNASRSFFIGSNGTIMGLGGTSGTISTQPLQISSTGAATLTGEVTISSGLLSISGSGGTPPTSGVGLRFVSNRLLIYGGSSDITFQKNSNASANMTILESGNVGIGVTPAAVSGITELAVGGASSNPKISGIRDGANAFMIYSASGGTEIFERRSGELVLGTNNTGRVWINNVGLVGIGISGMAFQLDVGGGVNGVTQNVCRIGNTAGYTNGLTVSKDTSNNYTFNFGGNSIIQSSFTYASTTTNAANMYIDSGAGQLYRSTSSIRFKTNVEDLSINTTEILSKMRPVWYRSLSNLDKKDWSWYGFIAEELALIEPRLIHWGYDETDHIYNEQTDKMELKADAKLIPDGVQYERITVLLVAEMQKMRKELDELKAK